MRRHTPNGIAEYDNVSMNIRVRKIDIVLAAVDYRSRPQRPNSVAGVRGLRTQKCRFTKCWAGLLGFPEYFGTRDFSRRPIQIAPVKATFASSSPFTSARQSSHERPSSTTWNIAARVSTSRSCHEPCSHWLWLASRRARRHLGRSLLEDGADLSQGRLRVTHAPPRCFRPAYAGRIFVSVEEYGGPDSFDRIHSACKSWCLRKPTPCIAGRNSSRNWLIRSHLYSDTMSPPPALSLPS